MFSYRDAEGTQESKPLAMEVNGDTVYIRKSIQKRTRETESGAMEYWSYKEATLTVAEYMENQVALVNAIESEKTTEEQADAYAELLIGQADIALAQAQQDDAIAETLLNTMTI